MSVGDKVKKIVAEQLGVEVSNVSLDDNLVDDLDADSLDMLEMCMEAEEVFNIDIDDEKVEKCTTVKSFVEVINANS